MRHFFHLATNDATKADCGAADGLIRMTVTNVNCSDCLDKHARRVA